MDPGFADAHQILGMTYADMNKFAEAIDELKNQGAFRGCGHGGRGIWGRLWGGRKN